MFINELYKVILKNEDVKNLRICVSNLYSIQQQVVGIIQSKALSFNLSGFGVVEWKFQGFI
jgi:hypothetical protein